MSMDSYLHAAKMTAPDLHQVGYLPFCTYLNRKVLWHTLLCASSIPEQLVQGLQSVMNDVHWYTVNWRCSKTTETAALVRTLRPKPACLSPQSADSLGIQSTVHGRFCQEQGPTPPYIM